MSSVGGAETDPPGAPLLGAMSTTGLPWPDRGGGPLIRPGLHMCALYCGAEQRDAVLLPYVLDGLRRGDKCVIGIDETVAGTVYDRVDEVQGALRTDQLLVGSSTEQLSSGGRSAIDGLIAFWDAAVRSARDDGYDFVRLAAEASWWLRSSPEPAEIAHDEVRLSSYAARHTPSVLCLYDVAAYGAGSVIDLVRLHQVILLSGLVLENPYYEPPDELELRSDAEGNVPYRRS
jgi:hypothetical protein